MRIARHARADRDWSRSDDFFEVIPRAFASGADRDCYENKRLSGGHRARLIPVLRVEEFRRAASVKRTGHTTGNAVQVPP